MEVCGQKLKNLLNDVKHQIL
ncbi:hypothetical protein DLD14_03490 [Legionella anisa]|nr:hypothetical protein DLD14_03490 [Legionella anisa]